ncbi:MAG: hypothetical protein J0M04_20895 [Verrucomicrobia bacterium]|nr:hypothetical protein [Verrucomicrobiota bacterium]
MRDFGEVFLALALWRRLGLHTLVCEIIEPCREAVPWELVACILTVARFCATKASWRRPNAGMPNSTLEDLPGVPLEAIHRTRLYRGLDRLHKHKDSLCQHLLKRYESWFGVEFKFLLYDVTSTYFEGKSRSQGLARLFARPAPRLQASQLRLCLHSGGPARQLRGLRRQLDRSATRSGGQTRRPCRFALRDLAEVAIAPGRSNPRPHGWVLIPPPMLHGAASPHLEFRA